jgi:hypothetical protein
MYRRRRRVGQRDYPGLRTLEELEDIVERGQRAFYLEVGAALAESRERQLYLPKTWTEYLKERFGFSRQHASRILQAKKFADASPVGDIPKTEREARKRIKEQRLDRFAKALTEDIDPEGEFKNRSNLALGKRLECRSVCGLTRTSNQSLRDPSGGNGVDLGSRVSMDPKTQFKLFTELVETWEIEMSQAEYLKLLEWIALFVDDHLIENDAPIEEGYPED